MEANKKGGGSNAVRLADLLHTIGSRGVDIYDNFDMDEEYCKPRVSKFAALHKFLTLKQGEQSIAQFVTALHKQAREYWDFGHTAEEWILHALA